MKRILTLIVCFAMLLSVATAEIDLSGLSYSELLALKEKVNLALWNTDEWQEVTVPAGIYLIGRDIPAGHWTITASPKIWTVDVTVGYMQDDSFKYQYGNYYILNGNESTFYTEGKPTSCDLILKNGDYLRIEDGAAIFTPFAGYNFGFKFN